MRGPVTWKAPAELVWLLVTPTMLHRDATEGSHASVADTEMVTEVCLWLGGQSVAGLADTDVIAGGTVSRTLTLAVQLLVL